MHDDRTDASHPPLNPLGELDMTLPVEWDPVERHEIQREGFRILVEVRRSATEEAINALHNLKTFMQLADDFSIQGQQEARTRATYVDTSLPIQESEMVRMLRIAEEQDAVICVEYLDPSTNASLLMKATVEDVKDQGAVFHDCQRQEQVVIKFIHILKVSDLWTVRLASEVT